MKFKEIDTKRINRNRLSIQVDRFFSSIKIYGKCDNKIFMMIDQNAGVFDLDKNKFIISDRRGIAYPVVDKNNNNYFMVINDEFNNKSYFVDYDKPKFRDSSNCYMYDMDYKPYTLECFCNIFDENNNNVQPMNKYLSNIYRFTNHVYGDGEIKNITYRDSDEDCNYSNLDNAYSIYDDLPTNISKNFKLISSSYSLKKIFEKQIKSINKDNFNLEVVYKKWKYSVINPNKGLVISFDNNIKNIEIIDNDIILLTSNIR